MNKNFTKIITSLILIFSVSICFSQDYLVTKTKDTIYGNIVWKTNVFVYVKNNDGKQKFKADAVDFFQRGAFRFVSIKTNFPEFLLEIKKGEVSYYVESHLKSKYTINYEKKVFLKYKDKLYPITVGNNKKDNDFINDPFDNTLNNNPLSNKLNNINLGGSAETYSSNFKWSFYQILGKENALYKLIKKNNYTFEDIELIVDLANISIKYPTKFKKQIDTTLKRGYASGYIIPLKNDTILGSIKMNGRFILGDRINFITKEGNELSYNPSELIEFKINNRIYKNDVIEKKVKQLSEIIVGKISMYRDLKKSKSYLIKENGEYVLVDKKKKFIDIFKDKPNIYKRIIENEYQPFEVKSMVQLYNNAP